LQQAIRVRKSENYGPTFSEPLRAVLQFEGAGAWPEDVEAIANVKRAFFLKIASGYDSEQPHLLLLSIPTH